MPFSKTTKEHTGEYWTKHFKFLKSLIEENPNLEACRSEALRGNILSEIIKNLVSSRVVVADLTDYNSNVYWELGVRQSFKHGTITIAEDGTKLPFDVGGKSTLFYNPKNHLEMTEFSEQFKKAIRDCLENPDRPDSHVLETLSGRGTLFEIFHRDEALRRLDAVISECDRNLGTLRDVVDTAKNNQKNVQEKKPRKFNTTRFRCSAADLLVTNRYVDENPAFFNLTEYYIIDIDALNEQLNIWEHKPGDVELWLLKYQDDWKGRFEAFKTKVKVAHNRLSKKF